MKEKRCGTEMISPAQISSLWMKKAAHLFSGREEMKINSCVAA
jgi:hypothetical protein